MGWTSRHEWLAIAPEPGASWSELAEITFPQLLEVVNELRAQRNWISQRPTGDVDRREYLHRVMFSASVGVDVEKALDQTPTLVNLLHAFLITGALVSGISGIFLAQGKRKDDPSSWPSWAAMWAFILAMGVTDYLSRRARRRRFMREVLTPALQNAFRELRVCDSEIEALLMHAETVGHRIGRLYQASDLSVGITERPVASLESEEEDLLWSADSAG
ncbi:MAG: hypothetical protein KDA30_14220 [Phycisphaerales bacterium]|nr:hypothetical protein [Phycisphaerales bacterium]